MFFLSASSSSIFWIELVDYHDTEPETVALVGT
jgi:hypothetical protein